MDIALTVGGSFLSAFLQVLFDRMANPEFLNLFFKQKFDNRILEKLKWKLLILQAVLEDAENKQSKNLAIKIWLYELQGVLYQADDLLDRINTEALRVKVENLYSSTTNQVSSSTESSKFSLEFLKEIMPELGEIVEKLEDFVQKIHILGLVKEVKSKNQLCRLPSTSLVEIEVFGRDADEEKIKAFLFDVPNKENVSVISIVGLGGIGKTTLVQSVYNDEKVNREFDTKAWVCISEEYDAIRITKDLLKELDISFDSNESFNSLQVKLKQGMSIKKFLLILDDIWNRDYKGWLSLSAPFNNGTEGSKIIVTTRDEKVALMLGSQHIYHLNLMSEDHCWSLFKKHVFNKADATGSMEFDLIGKEIVKRCGGLPLAVTAVAGLLRSKQTIQEWNEILTSDEWDQPNHQAGILPSLRLSYAHLPSHLKRCFAYCTVFHKDYRFSEHEVILLWMANDLLESPRSKKRLEDIGHEFFYELRFRSLFQQSSDGKFSMHDLVNDLAKSVSGEYFLRLEDFRQQNTSLIGVRHFSYISSEHDVSEKFKPLIESKFLRTFLPIDFQARRSKWLSQKFLLGTLPASKSLRVLSLSGYEITDFPKSFCNLKQLRFLNLSFMKIQWLPSWICALYNLQTLLLVDCWRLKELPEEMERLINLRHLDISGVPLAKMPMEIEKLENLQSLSSFIINKYHDASFEELMCQKKRIEALGKLSNLSGEFTISGLENVANGKHASMAKMKDKKNIKKLTLKWNSDSNCSRLARDVLEDLQPHSNIEHLTIQRYCGTKFPGWLEDPSFCHMVSLCLYNCENCFSLPAIGQLPSLKHLTVSGLSKVLEVNQEFYGNMLVTKPFPCLNEFRISNMEEWKEWHIPKTEAFSSLEELYIEDCPKLIGETPKQLPSLRKLVIAKCPQLVNSEGEFTVFDPSANFSSLRELRISGMPNVKELSSLLHLNILLPHLEKLEIDRCEDIVSVQFNCLPTKLKQLIVRECWNLELDTGTMTHVSIENLDIWGGHTDSIKNLSLSLFQNLRSLSIQRVKNIGEMSLPQPLQSLSISHSDKFESFPVGRLPNLTDLILWNLPKLKRLPEGMNTLLQSLRDLKLWECPEIECFPEGGLPSTLQSLQIYKCKRLWNRRSEWGLQKLPSLVRFDLLGTREETLPPDDLLLPPTLTILLLYTHENLQTLNCSVLQHLTCLQFLIIGSCPKLQSLPEEGLPASLSKLVIRTCPLLKQSLDWEKFAHIPCIMVDDELFP